jgi:hypothetical protein
MQFSINKIDNATTGRVDLSGTYVTLHAIPVKYIRRNFTRQFMHYEQVYIMQQGADLSFNLTKSLYQETLPADVSIVFAVTPVEETNKSEILHEIATHFRDGYPTEVGKEVETLVSLYYAFKSMDDIVDIAYDITEDIEDIPELPAEEEEEPAANISEGTPTPEPAAPVVEEIEPVVEETEPVEPIEEPAPLEEASYPEEEVIYTEEVSYPEEEPEPEEELTEIHSEPMVTPLDEPEEEPIPSFNFQPAHVEEEEPVTEHIPNFFFNSETVVSPRHAKEDTEDVEEAFSSEPVTLVETVDENEEEVFGHGIYDEQAIHSFNWNEGPLEYDTSMEDTGILDMWDEDMESKQPEIVLPEEKPKKTRKQQRRVLKRARK